MSAQPAGSAEGSTAPFLPEMEIEQPERQRRWTVLLRLLLLIPHFIVLYLVSLAAVVVVVLGWFAALALGRLPSWISDFLGVVIGYQTRIGASSMLLIDKYPPFLLSQPDYPVQLDIRPGRLNRWAVLFRFILIIPIVLLNAILSHGWGMLSFFLWLVVLVMGRVPRPVFDATAAILRFAFRVQCYTYLLTGSYPKRLFGDQRAEPKPSRQSPGTRPLVMSSGGRAMLIVFLVLGVIGFLGNAGSQAYQDMNAPAQYEHGVYATGLDQ